MHSGMFRRLSLQRKLLLLVLGLSLVSAFCAAAALFVFQNLTLRREFTDHAVAMARIVAPWSAAPIAFEDQGSIDRTIAILSSKPEFIAARIIDPNGKILGSIGGELPAMDAWPLSGTHDNRGWNLIITEPIMAKDEVLGQLLLIADFRPVFWNSFWTFIPTLGIVLLATLVLAGLFTLLISRMVTRRLATLAYIATEITKDGSFSLRAPATEPDEIGTLTEAFNSMISRLATNDASLRAANVSLKSEIAQKERLQAELLEASRLAGMAEIATGVLHNVGNVLNSVNVSAGILRDLLINSQIDKVRLSAEMLRAQGDQLGTFMTEDPKGRLLPGFLVELAKELSKEQNASREELTRLTRSIDHIKGIVALQQGYAKSTAVIEDIHPGEILEHALLINQALLAKNQVEVLREIPTKLPPLCTDRHKILQILINLVSNAAHATETKAVGKRTIRVSVVQAASNSIQFLIKDNGIGIPKELIPRLFNQGFTTRAEGHGFGLHSAALAARQIGAEISVVSEGPGRGACFTLAVPLSFQPLTPSASP